MDELSYPSGIDREDVPLAHGDYGDDDDFDDDHYNTNFHIGEVPSSVATPTVTPAYTPVYTQPTPSSLSSPQPPPPPSIPPPSQSQRVYNEPKLYEMVDRGELESQEGLLVPKPNRFRTGTTITPTPFIPPSLSELYRENIEYHREMISSLRKTYGLMLVTALATITTTCCMVYLAYVVGQNSGKLSDALDQASSALTTSNGLLNKFSPTTDMVISDLQAKYPTWSLQANSTLYWANATAVSLGNIATAKNLTQWIEDTRAVAYRLMTTLDRFAANPSISIGGLPVT